MASNRLTTTTPIIFRLAPLVLTHAAHERIAPASAAPPRPLLSRTDARRVYFFVVLGRWVAASEVRAWLIYNVDLVPKCTPEAVESKYQRGCPGAPQNLKLPSSDGVWPAGGVTEYLRPR